MGIEGLLGVLKPIIEKDHISNFKDKTAAVDGMAWLYKGKQTTFLHYKYNILLLFRLLQLFV